MGAQGIYLGVVKKNMQSMFSYFVDPTLMSVASVITMNHHRDPPKTLHANLLYRSIHAAILQDKQQLLRFGVVPLFVGHVVCSRPIFTSQKKINRNLCFSFQGCLLAPHTKKITKLVLANATTQDLHVRVTSVSRDDNYSSDMTAEDALGACRT